MSVFGLDFAWDRPSSMGALKAAGVKFVCRYLSAGAGGSKDLTPGEAKQLSAAGVNIVVVWETGAGRAKDGHHAGVLDAQAASRQARTCGMPNDRPIYFAVDFDGSSSEVTPYFQGVKSVLGWRTGVYGSYNVCKGLLDAGLVGWAWQTYAWSAGQWDKRAHLQQYSNDHNAAGVSCDYDRALFLDYGQWRVGWSPGVDSAYPTLKRGSRGGAVGRLSRNLHYLQDPENKGRAYYAPDWPLRKAFPGLPFFTGGLESAVQTFQFRHGLHRTGVTDRATWDAIAKAIQTQKAGR